MNTLFEGVAPMVYESGISVPYSWWAGDTASRFFLGLRDEWKIWGTRCASCGKVHVPPRKTCPICFKDSSDWVEVSTEGLVQDLHDRQKTTGGAETKRSGHLRTDSAGWGGYVPAARYRRRFSGSRPHRDAGQGKILGNPQGRNTGYRLFHALRIRRSLHGSDGHYRCGNDPHRSQ